MQKGLVDDSAGFLRIPFAIINELKGECEAMVLLAYLCNTYNMLNHADKLGSDGSFYLSSPRIMDALGFTRRKYEQARKILLEKKLISVEVKPTDFGRVQFFILNYSQYNNLVVNNNYAPKLAECDELNTPPAPVAKNATTEIIEVKETLPVVKVNDEYKTKIINAWNLIAEKHELPKIIMLKEDRLKKFKAVIKYLGVDEKTFFNKLHFALLHSKFLRGVGQKWRADFDFFLSKQKALKAIEGGYKDNTNEYWERLSDVETMSYKEAQEAREKIALQEWERKLRAKEAKTIENKKEI